jgi:hypothetical protein
MLAQLPCLLDQPAGEAAPTALRIRIRCRRREAPSVLCQIGNAFTGELAPRFVIVIDHRSLLPPLLIFCSFLSLADIAAK